MQWFVFIGKSGFVRRMNQTCRDFGLDELTRRLAIRFYNMCVISNELHDKQRPKLRLATAGLRLRRKVCFSVWHGPAHNQKLARLVQELTYDFEIRTFVR